MKTYCDGRQNGTQCYGPLGATVVLHLMDSLLEIPKYEWRRQCSTIFKGRTNTIFPHPLQSRYLLMPSNGTFTIKNLMKADSGKYTLETFNSDGQKTGQHTLQLTVQGEFPFLSDNVMVMYHISDPDLYAFSVYYCKL